MQGILQYIWKNKFNFLLIICWALIVIPAVFNHELWYDEILAYHTVKTLPFKSILYNLQTNQGHPILWYVVQFPFVKSGLSAEIIQYLAFFFVFASVCYFTLRSRFNILVKFLFLFSSGMLYLLPVLPRNYSLMPILFFILADLYPNRHKRPILYGNILILLSQVHSLVWGFCIITSFFFIIEFFKDFKTKYIGHLIATILLVGNFLSTLFFFRHFILTERSGEFSISWGVIKEFFTFVPQHLYIFSFTYYLFLISMLVFVITLFILNKKSGFIFISSVAAFEFILLIVYTMYGVPLQKIFVVFLMMIFCAWIIRDSKGIAKYINDAVLIILLAIFFSHPFSYPLIQDEINKNFSNLPLMGKFFDNKLESDEKILAIGSPMFYEVYLPAIPPEAIIGVESFDVPEVVDNEYIDALNNPNIKYIIIHDKIKYNLTEPYKKVFKTPDNKINSIEIFNPPEDDFVIFENK